jgi:hypothetical protein
MQYILFPYTIAFENEFLKSKRLSFLLSVGYKTFKNSIIHEENTKKNHKSVVSLYVIEISLDLHKL